MDFLQLAKQRHSVRKYKKQNIEDEKVFYILEAGRVAPTAANAQPQKILMIRTEKGLNKAAKAVKTFNAPLIFIVCGDKKAAWTRPHDSKNMLDIDTSIVTDHMMLAAQSIGISTCWMTHFDPDILRKEFNIPEDFEPINILLAGYSDETAPADENRHEKTRKVLSKTVFSESF